MLIALALLALPTPLLQSPVELRRQFTPDAEDTYRLQFSSRQKVQTPKGQVLENVGMESSMKLVLRTTEVKPDGTATIEATLSDLVARKPETKEEPTVDPNKYKSKLILRPDNGADDVQVESEDQQAQLLVRSALASLFEGVKFPQKPVKAGDTWEISVPPLPMDNKKETLLKLRYDGERVVEGRTMRVVSMDQRIPISLKLPPGPGEKKESTMSGNVTLKLLNLYDAMGRLVNSESSMKHEFRMVNPGTKQELSGTREESTTIQLVAPGA